MRFFFNSYKTYYKRNLLLAIPVVLSQTGQVSVQLADNMMVGHVGTTELAAASFANSIFIIGLVLGLGLTFGITPLVGKAYGNNNFSHAASMFHHSIIGNAIISILLVSILWILSIFMPYMGQNPEVVKLALPYYYTLMVSIFPFMFFFTGKQFIEGLGNTSMAMKITIFANIINIYFNYLLIYGHAGFKAYGLLGAGYATLLSRIIMAIMFALFMIRNPHFKRYFYLINLKDFQIKKLTLFFKTGLPIGLQMLAEVTLFSLAAIMMGWIGKTELAAHQIAINISTVSFMIATGVSSATTIRVSHQFGANKLADVKKAGLASVHIIIAFMSTTAILFFVFRHQLPYLFTTDPEVVKYASQFLILSAIFQIFDGSQVVLLGALRGLSDVNKAFFLALITYLVIGVPLIYFFAFILKLNGVGIWIGLAIALALAAVLFFIRFTNNCKKYALLVNKSM